MPTRRDYAVTEKCFEQEPDLRNPLRCGEIRKGKVATYGQIARLMAKIEMRGWLAKCSACPNITEVSMPQSCQPCRTTGTDGRNSVFCWSRGDCHEER